MDSVKWLERHRRVIAGTMRRDYDPQHTVVIQNGQGARVWDVDGKEYIDLTCGYSVTNLGHKPEAVLQAATEQLGRLAHLTGRIHPSQVELAELLLEVTRPSNQREDRQVVFNSTGSRAIETAMVAAQAVRPGRVLSVSPTFHGKSIGTQVHSLVARPSSENCAPTFDSTSIRRPPDEYPYCGRCPLNTTFPACSLACSQPLFDFIHQNASDISALLIEPILGARGYIEPPTEYFHRLSDLADQHGILTITDGVQSGLGRCGAWLCSQQQGWTPDLVVLGKSLGAGIVPISAVLGRSEILSALAGQQVSETFAGSPFACSVGLATLQHLRDANVIAWGANVGKELRREAKRIFVENASSKAPWIEGRGCVCALEFAYENAPHAQQHAREFTQACTSAGLLVHWSGPIERTRVVLLPPLNLTASELEETVLRLKQATSTWLQQLHAQQS